MLLENAYWQIQLCVLDNCKKYFTTNLSRYFKDNIVLIYALENIDIVTKF